MWEQNGRPQFLLEVSGQSGRDIGGLCQRMGYLERCVESRMNRMWGQIDCGSQRKSQLR